ncbi:nucleotide sugar dehydrogenase [Vibrio jasicida]|uniref:Nucleotide sugar dehydrogenase n=1 Tax=Vibrio jasicida TaxID=766224 RepID=A0ABW7J832_9VIBR
MNLSLDNARVGIIGLGYVGLPLAVEFGKKAPTIGFDINQARIDELTAGRDSTLECSDNELAEAIHLSYTASLKDLKECNVYIVTVPTPIDEHKQPDLTPLIKASEALGTVVSEGDVIIYESTVYPGATEEDCIPVVERVSGLKFNQDFFAGYSPERINPGDKQNRLTTIKKVTSGSTNEVACFVDKLYGTIITAGTFKASSIKVAEASKVIENVQRDVNIALVNELHQIFYRLDINTREVIDAASTKWNFMKLTPGLVGGHCIGVDPYYLLHKAKSKGYIPDLIRTSREINDSMPYFVASKFLKELIANKINPIGTKVLLLGFTFKENCPDIRNTKNYDLYIELKNLGFNVTIYDPWLNKKEAFEEYGLNILSSLPKEKYDASILAVNHDVFDKEIKYCDNLGFIFDFKR